MTRICLFMLLAMGLMTYVHALYRYDVHEEILDKEWETFKAQHGKKYLDDREEEYRRKIFIENRNKIASHNLLSSRNDGVSFGLKMNEYGDMLHSEFIKVMNGYRHKKRSENATMHVPSNYVVPPTELDWRKFGYVTPVKNQKHCGSCWAFSSTGALEAQTYRKTKKLISLSEQNLIDCSSKNGNNGCNGGLMDNAFEYIKENHGIDTESSYPYEARDNKCRYKSANKGADDLGAVDLPEGDEDALLEALATVGPVSIAIDASHESFQFYSHGVYDEPECSNDELDHGVLLVGYGTDPKTNMDYWLVKNSWGTSWGDEGYIRMVRNKKNQCGVATSASYPRL